MQIAHLALLALGAFTLSSSTHAAGLWLHETGTEDLGTGNSR